MWTSNPSRLCAGNACTWSQAQLVIDNINQNGFCAYKDWRMPTINELRSLINYAEPDNASWLNQNGFNIISNSKYWSSTSKDTTDIWSIGISSGEINTTDILVTPVNYNSILLVRDK
jgi:hypothetical protein